MANHYDGQPSKRLKTDFVGGVGNDGGYDDPHKTPPSVVLHVRGLSERAMEQDLMDAVQHFGPVTHIHMMPRKRQALVEFQDIQAARSCVMYCQNNQIFVAGQPAFFNYSTSQRIERQHGADFEKNKPNQVLLMTILNPAYPITTDVVQKICAQFGEVQRIVIFKKNGVQAMVEFDSVDSATCAMQQLNGADIYSGCCTIKIEFAKPTRLNVFKNDNDSWDYTQPNLGKYGQQVSETPAPPRRAPLLQEPPQGGRMRDDRRGPMAPYDDYGGDGGGYGGIPGGPPGRRPGFGPVPDRGYGPPVDRYSNPAQGIGGSPQGAVVMVYGLNPDKVNCDRLFNVFCLYGNVLRTKFLKSKPGVAMIQMGDATAVERAIHHLNNTYYFDNKMQIGRSKQAYLNDVPQPYTLPDGSTSFKDYMGSRNNRFTSVEQANKNRIQSPSKVVHFYNVPFGITEEQVKKLFEEVEAIPPDKVIVFPAKSERSASGLAEWERPEGAFEALVIANHMQVPNPNGKFPYTLKLCFSSVPRGSDQKHD
ncbi:PREDICTED: heterogeneous nuclear ribonucleoprotein L-like isoform X2 [Priapulus caudatus]|uniref:Heterogeneous nuclear ribonucleoprotein L-like isoform X2 n=1 Tax=Priapulus caudatus TaxID=37621 RepID=A0ABM1DPW8_PRICU|nr:PREDICTED: heterogeneous nuclear ribonucleoprotein L-like isoform X2 [Priapulus caudatus]